jgi:hypothetical protein
MSRTRPSLRFRIRYEGRVQIFDRRPLRETEAERGKSPIHYIVARTLSRFRLGRPPPPTSPEARDK